MIVEIIEKEKMKMKKLFIGVMSVLLVLSMAGMVSGLPSIQDVDNATVMGSDDSKWVSGVVNVTLNLESDFVVTIPADFSFSASTHSSIEDQDGRKMVYYSTPHGVGTQPVQVNVDVLLLEAGKNVSVNVTAGESGYFDSGFTYSDGNGDTQNGAWNLTSTSDVLHYALSVGSGHFVVTKYYNDVDGVLGFTYDGSDLLISDGNVVKTNVSKDVTLHALVLEKPKTVDTYTGKLKFTVNVV